MSNRLVKHLSHLLLREECVVVRGLGGFIVEEKPAYWDKKNFLAYPPSVSLHFNERLDHQDGLLEAHYAETYSVSFRRSRLMIEQDVREIHQSLARTQSYVLEGLGELKLSLSGTLSFISEPCLLKNMATYGLVPVYIPSSSEAQAPLSLSQKANLDKAYVHFRLSKRMLAWTAAAAVCFVALYPWKGHVQQDQHYQASLVPSAEVLERFFTKEILPKEDTLKAQVSRPEVQPQASNSETQVKVLEVKSEAKSEEDQTFRYIKKEIGRYYVIIASERKGEIMLKHYHKAQESGIDFPELGLLSQEKYYRMSAGSFDTSKEAYKYLFELKKLGYTSWVYKAK